MQVSDCSDFVGKSGQALVNELSQSTPECVGKLYSLKGSAATALFSEANVISVANAIAAKAKDYTGVDVQHLSPIFTLSARPFMCSFTAQMMCPLTAMLLRSA